MKACVSMMIILTLCGMNALAQSDTVNQLDENGKRTGYWVAYYPSGQQQYAGYFVNGLPVDTLIRYYPDGIIKARIIKLEQGQLYFGQLYDEQGRLSASGNYEHEKKQGRWRFYDSQQNPLILVDYQQDKLNGVAIRFYANGTILEKTHWINNELTGKRQMYNEQGKLILEAEYESGQMHGAYTAFTDQGSLFVKGAYAKGLKTGEWQYFHANGQPAATVTYDQGIVMNPEVLDSLGSLEFEKYEHNRKTLRDPKNYLNDPFSYIRK